MPLQSITINCFHCGTSFDQLTDQKHLTKYCSSECARTANRLMSKVATDLIMQLVCIECECSFSYQNRQGSLPKYCSERCRKRVIMRRFRHHKTASVARTCKHCGAEFYPRINDLNRRDSKNRGLFCSIRCLNDYQHERRVERRSSILTEAWREYVFERDSHRCRACGSSKKLNAHHIKPWSLYPSLRFDPANGITLCDVCHKRLHHDEHLATMGQNQIASEQLGLL